MTPSVVCGVPRDRVHRLVERCQSLAHHIVFPFLWCQHVRGRRCNLCTLITAEDHRWEPGS